MTDLSKDNLRQCIRLIKQVMKDTDMFDAGMLAAALILLKNVREAE